MTRSDSHFSGERIGHWTLLEKVDNDFWKCRCDCGTERNVSVYSIYAGDTKSCGCERRKPKDDLTGRQYGNWTVIRYERKGKWLCKCVCGKEHLVTAQRLKSGRSESCGCRRYEKVSRSVLNDLTGKRFGKLTVVSYAGKERWNCLCDCGKTHNVKGQHLKNGHVTSCGCNLITHGMSNTNLYHVWNTMRQRCENPNSGAFKNYGGRGISVCHEWTGENGFAAFYEWAITFGYKPGLSIDRIDVNGNYCPENCRWVDDIEQANNRRCTIFYEFDGEKMTLRQISEKYNLPAESIRKRLRTGMSIEDAVASTISAKERGKIGKRTNHRGTESSASPV